MYASDVYASALGAGAGPYGRWSEPYRAPYGQSPDATWVDSPGVAAPGFGPAPIAYARAAAATLDAGPLDTGPLDRAQSVTGPPGAATLDVPTAGMRPAGDMPAATPRGPRRRLAPVRPDSWRRLVPQALVVAFLAGGTSAFVSADKGVTLSVDGKTRTLHTFADDVDELLDEEGLDLGAHDVVAPGRGAGLDSGDEVVVRHGRPLQLTLDGIWHQVWTTADTVDGALRELGVRADGAHLSVPRSQRIARTGLSLEVRTERTVTVMADGRERTVRTNAATVREAVRAAGVTLHGQDTTSVPQDSFPRDGQTLKVLRIVASQEVRDERVAYDVRRVEDASLDRGTVEVVRQGRPGARRLTYAVRTVNGVREKPRLVRTETVREPRAEHVRVGTRELPASVQGADGLNWGALAACESGGRPDATDPSGTYGGLYQFDTQTWQSLGGSGRPQDASAAEQTSRAKKLYVQRGASPWPHCGARLEA
ncbi:resuscitation-promoting factor [Streptomyces sp. YIM 130001]|uniref:resuscitation-promoting factor n=1 Tax=Streptomyces sp. YIM 130001 TaxID=2259644 RepID=UPI000E65A9F5|nr:resuscitation-promoting factor [Streptomyces sp. YIM 130001]